MKVLIISLILVLQFSARSNENFPFIDRSNVPHNVQTLNGGIAAFYKRLEIIEKAQVSIEVEYFIYSVDQIGKLLTNALIKKAREGKRVRLLVDSSATVFQLKDNIAALLKKEGVEVRYYNRVPLLLVISSQYRDHRKMLVVDDKYVVTGGRNIADEYFDNSDTYNFLDRDIYFEGPLAKTLRESFDLYWTDEITSKPKEFKRPSIDDYNIVLEFGDLLDDGDETYEYESAMYYYNKKLKIAQDFLTMNEEDKELLKKYNVLGKELLKKEVTDVCQDLTFATDAPGKGYNTRFLRVALNEMLDEVKEDITIDSPYFVLQYKQRSAFNSLLEKGININLLTNSLNSTDAIYIASVFNVAAPIWSAKGINFYIHRGVPLEGQTFLRPEIKNATWGTHSKTAVYDHDNFLVGTYNVDPRSKNLNSELIMICRDGERLAQSILEDIQTRSNYPHSVKLDNKGMPVDGSSKVFGASLSKKALYYLLAIPAHIAKSLL
jgi:cardiolipin synthase C